MRIKICIVLLLIASTRLFSQDRSIAYPEVKYLLDLGLLKNEQTIKEKSVFLDQEGKVRLYGMYQKGALLPAVLNTLPGYGVGSFIQDDMIGGVISLSADLVALGFYIATVGRVGYLVGTSFLPMDRTKDLEAANLFLTTGLLISLANRVFGVVRPIYYAKGWNNKLEDALNMKRAPTLSLGPLVTPSGMGFAITVSL